MPDNDLQPTNSQFILYQDDEGIFNINIHFEGKDGWYKQFQR